MRDEGYAGGDAEEGGDEVGGWGRWGHECAVCSRYIAKGSSSSEAGRKK